MLKNYKFVIRNLVAPASLLALAFRGTGTLACALGFSSWHNHFRLRSWVARERRSPDRLPPRLRRGAALLRPISAQSKPFVIPNPPEAGEARFVRPVRFAGVGYGFPSHVLCAMNLSSPVLSSRPEQRRLLPLRSGGMVATLSSSSFSGRNLSRSPLLWN
jgi:hypothetical protein